MSKHDYIRSVVDGAWDLTAGDLAKKVEVALPGKMFRVNCGDTSVAVEFDDELLPADVVVVDQEVSDLQAAFDALPKYKKHKTEEIDKKTDELIAKGFLFAGVCFSASDNARQRIIACDLMRDDPNTVYPIAWNSHDDTDKFSIPNSATMHAFALTAMGTLRAHIDSGTAFKDSVRGASSIFEVDLVVDDR